MKFDISDAEKINLHEAIEVCPHCGKSITPLLCTYHSSHNEFVLSSTYYAICQCPSKACNAIFFAKYDVEDFPIPRNLDELLANIRNIEIFPLPSVSISMDTVIKKISPLFIETYNQAVTAHQARLAIPFNSCKFGLSGILFAITFETRGSCLISSALSGCM